MFISKNSLLHHDGRLHFQLLEKKTLQIIISLYNYFYISRKSLRRTDTAVDLRDPAVQRADFNAADTPLAEQVSMPLSFPFQLDRRTYETANNTNTSDSGDEPHITPLTTPTSSTSNTSFLLRENLTEEDLLGEISDEFGESMEAQSGRFANLPDSAASNTAVKNPALHTSTETAHSPTLTSNGSHLSSLYSKSTSSNASNTSFLLKADLTEADLLGEMGGELSEPMEVQSGRSENRYDGFATNTAVQNSASHTRIETVNLSLTSSGLRHSSICSRSSSSNASNTSFLLRARLTEGALLREASDEFSEPMEAQSDRSQSVHDDTTSDTTVQNPASNTSIETVQSSTLTPSGLRQSSICSRSSSSNASNTSFLLRARLTEGALLRGASDEFSEPMEAQSGCSENAHVDTTSNTTVQSPASHTRIETVPSGLRQSSIGSQSTSSNVSNTSFLLKAHLTEMTLLGEMSGESSEPLRTESHMEIIQSDRCADAVPGSAHKDHVTDLEVAVMEEIDHESHEIIAGEGTDRVMDDNEITETDQAVAEEIPENSDSERRNNETLSDEEPLHILHVESCQDTENSEQRPPFDSEARHIVKFSHILKQIKEQFASGLHGPFHCGIENQVQIGEKRDGFRTKFIMRCEMCNLQSEIWSELEDDNYLDVNNCAVVGTHAIGKGYAALEEFSANMAINCMPYKMYQRLSVEIDNHYVELAEEHMTENHRKERELALAEGRVVDGIPTCAVIVDGSWPVTTYNKGARSESGMVVIVSERTKKILWYCYKNRYCLVCQRAINAGIPIPLHRCYINWPKDKSILSVESVGIVEGFKDSWTRGIMFSRIVADGDSSVYKEICDADPYEGRLWVEKVECRLHIQRCRVRDIRNALGRFKTGRDEQAKELKKIIFKSIARICKDVTSAASRWNKKIIDQQDKEANLKTEMMNILHHVLGDHANCADFCDKRGNSTERNWIPFLEHQELYSELQKIMETWSNYAKDLLIGLTANLAECFNSVLAKYIYEKGVNVQLRGIYRGRTAMAVVQFDSQDVGSALHYKLDKIPPSQLLQMERNRRAKNNYNKKYKKIKKISELAPGETENMRQSSSYGLHSEQPDKLPDVYQREVNEHWNTLSDWQAKRDEIEETTRNNDGQYLLKKKKLLVAKDFGHIFRMRASTPTASTVEKMLYPPKKSNAIKLHEKKMRRKVLERFEGVQDCGLIIDEDKPFLATRPDALIGDDTILIVHCPYNICDYSVQDAMKMPKLGLKKLFKKDMTLNPTHPILYEIIGSLAITKRKFCQLAICTNINDDVICIPADETLWKKVIPKLQIFYENYMLPEIVDSRKNRHMDLRDKVRSRGVSADGETTNALHQDQDHHPCNANFSNDIDHDDDNELRSLNGDNHGGNEEFMAQDLTDTDFMILLGNFELEDSHMDVFGHIVLETANELYDYQSPSLHVSLERIREIDPFRKHIQILNRGGRHWVGFCYDQGHITIFDSLQTERTEQTLSEYYPYLSRLFPYYPLDRDTITIANVQQQTNGTDCGVFAIAFAVTLMYGLDPADVTYDVERMRDHLCNIYLTRNIEHFPLAEGIDMVIPDLADSIEREREALLSRIECLERHE